MCVCVCGMNCIRCLYVIRIIRKLYLKVKMIASARLWWQYGIITISSNYCCHRCQSYTLRLPAFSPFIPFIQHSNRIIIIVLSAVNDLRVHCFKCVSFKLNGLEHGRFCLTHYLCPPFPLRIKTISTAQSFHSQFPWFHFVHPVDVRLQAQTHTLNDAVVLRFLIRIEAYFVHASSSFS